MTTTIIATEAHYAALTDVEVVHELSDVIARVDDDDLSGQLYFLTGELLERFAPEVEREANMQELEKWPGDDLRDREIVDHDEALARRAKLRSLLVPLAEEE